MSSGRSVHQESTSGWRRGAARDVRCARRLSLVECLADCPVGSLSNPHMSWFSFQFTCAWGRPLFFFFLSGYPFLERSRSFERALDFPRSSHVKDCDVVSGRHLCRSAPGLVVTSAPPPSLVSIGRVGRGIHGVLSPLSSMSGFSRYSGRGGGGAAVQSLSPSSPRSLRFIFCPFIS